MDARDTLYIGGEWLPASGAGIVEVDEAATGEIIGTTPAADASDVDAAVRAARGAFDGWSVSPIDERAAILRDIAQQLEDEGDELAILMSREVGTTLATSRKVQVDLSIAVFRSMADLIEDFPLEEVLGSATVVKVPKGVVGAITPWNYPLYQIAAKLAPAIAAGCTMVVKPSSIAPLAAFRLADIIDRTSLPRGVFNLVTGPGAEVGELLVTHPGVDMVSLTGSVRAGRRVAELAARDIKRVTLELGGKSAFVLLPGADLDAALSSLLSSCFANNGQTCSATTRLVLPHELVATVEEMLESRVSSMRVGDPLDATTDVGPVASAAQRDSIQSDLRRGIGDGTLITGGLGPVDGLERGWFVRPTVVSRLTNQAPLARDEVFGPVLAVVPVRDADEAVAVANDSDYGLSGAVFAGDDATAESVARRLRTGRVSVNGGKSNVLSPFGGFRKSGIGRELGPHGLAEYFELMALHLPVGS